MLCISIAIRTGKSRHLRISSIISGSTVTGGRRRSINGPDDGLGIGLLSASNVVPSHGQVGIGVDLLI
jgi:hypothetical protein